MLTTSSLPKVTRNAQHLLHDLLPPLREQHYSLRERSHNCCLPDRVSTLMDKNFCIRMLCKDFSCLTLHSFSSQRSIISHVFVLFARNRFVPVMMFTFVFFFYHRVYLYCLVTVCQLLLNL